VIQPYLSIRFVSTGRTAPNPVVSRGWCRAVSPMVLDGRLAQWLAERLKVGVA
jgi:hypothetical protein